MGDGGDGGELGVAAVMGGPFKTEREAYLDAKKHCNRRFITGQAVDDSGWYWAIEEHFVGIAGNRLEGVNEP